MLLIGHHLPNTSWGSSRLLCLQVLWYCEMHARLSWIIASRFFFFPSCFTPIYNPWGYDRHATLVSLHLFSCLIRCPLSIPYCGVSLHLLLRLLGFFPPQFCLPRFSHLADFHPPDHFVAPIPTLSPPTPSLPPTSVAFKNSNSGPSALSSATRFANSFFSVQPCRLIFFALKLLTSFLLCLLHLRHFVYRCSTNCSPCLHHQYSGVSLTPFWPGMSQLHRVQL